MTETSKLILKNIGQGLFYGAVAILAWNAAISIHSNLPSSHAEYENQAQAIEHASDKINHIRQVLDKESYYPVKEQDVEEGLCLGYYSSIMKDDPYAAYYPAIQYKEIKQEDNGQIYSIGAIFMLNTETEQYYVEDIYEGSDADKSGLKIGDILVSVNGELIHMKQSLSEYLSPDEFTLQILRPLEDGTQEKHDIHCKKEIIERSDIEARVYEKDDVICGYMKLYSFSHSGGEEFKNQMKIFKEKEINHLIIDLQDNPGGNVQVACDLLSLFVPNNLTTFTETNNKFKNKALLTYIADKNGDIIDAFYSEGTEKYDIPITILINNDSASCSELFAGCLQDYGLATIKGKQSYGKGVYQKTITLEDGTAFSFTSGLYFLPSGRTVNQTGITPDEEL